jgi:two-component system sensor histidine kinase CpxA
MVGPFSVRDGEDNYQLYLIRPASTSQSDFINLLFDRPLLLLIVTMLVSSPLLLAGVESGETGSQVEKRRR